MKLFNRRENEAGMPRVAHVAEAFEALRKRERGFALHDLFLYNVLIGLHAQHVLEFGAGGSTTIALQAMRVTGGLHRSISTQEPQEVDGGATWWNAVDMATDGRTHWLHTTGQSQTICTPEFFFDFNEPLDLILHDGSHAADVVERDLRAALPQLRTYGLILVHDTQHSYVGHEVRAAVNAILKDFPLSHTTLPYGFGLTILRLERGDQLPVDPSPAKDTSEHFTALCPLKGGL